MIYELVGVALLLYGEEDLAIRKLVLMTDYTIAVHVT
jgi:hypothetical protein